MSKELDFSEAFDKREEVMLSEYGIDMQMTLFDDQYRELSDRAGVEDDYGRSFDDLLHNTDATFSAYVIFHEDDTPELSLTVQSEELGYRDYDIIISPAEAESLTQAAEKALTERGRGETFDQLFLEGKLFMDITPLDFAAENIDVDRSFDGEVYSTARLTNLSEEQFKELFHRAEIPIEKYDEASFAVAEIYCDQSVTIEVTNERHDFSVDVQLMKAEQEKVFSAMEAALGKELDIRKAPEYFRQSAENQKKNTKTKEDYAF